MPNIILGFDDDKFKCRTCKYLTTKGKWASKDYKLWCSKCDAEIEDRYIPFDRPRAKGEFYYYHIPKGCYFNDYYEVADKYKKPEPIYDYYDLYD